MRILISTLILIILTSLFLYNYHQFRQVNQMALLIRDVGGIMELGGRQRFEVEQVVSDVHKNQTEVASWLTEFQSNEIFTQKKNLSIYAEQLSAWPSKEAFAESREQLSALKEVFLQEKFTEGVDKNNFIFFQNWKTAFITVIDKLQLIDVNLIAFTASRMDRHIQKMVFINVAALVAIILACFGVFLFDSREQLNRKLRAEATAKERENELLRSRNIFKSLAEDLSSEHSALIKTSERLNQTNLDLGVKHEQMDQAIEELKRSNEQLERFAFVCSHDLQEPVRMVLSFSQLLEKRVQSQLDEKDKEYLSYITDGAKRARDMIRDILVFCRLEQATEPHIEIDLNQTCQQVHDTLFLTIQEKGGVFKWASLPEIKGIPSQIFQLFLNLVSNGIKFNQSEQAIVKIYAEEESDCWAISVQDNGIGIDQKYVDKLFVIFSRLNAKEEFPGTGIGLAICKKITEQHDATIKIEPRSEGGACFVIRWPK